MNTPFVNKSSWVIHWFSSWFIILSWMIVNCSLARSAVSCKTTYERPRVQQRHTSLTSFNKFDNTPGNKSTPTSSCRRSGVANIDATEKSRFYIVIIASENKWGGYLSLIYNRDNIRTLWGSGSVERLYYDKRWTKKHCSVVDSENICNYALTLSSNYRSALLCTLTIVYFKRPVT